MWRALSSVYAAVSEVTEAVSAEMDAVRVVLFSMSWARVVFSCVAAFARLSRYPSKRSKVVLSRSSCLGVRWGVVVVAARAVPDMPVDDVARSWRLRAIWAAR